MKNEKKRIKHREYVMDQTAPNTPFQSRMAMEHEDDLPPLPDVAALIDAENFQDLHTVAQKAVRDGLHPLIPDASGVSLLERLVSKILPEHFFGSDLNAYSPAGDGRVVGKPDPKRFAPMQKTLEAMCSVPPANPIQAVHFLKALNALDLACRGTFAGAPARTRSAAFFAYAVAAASPAAEEVRLMIKERADLRALADSLSDHVEEEVFAVESRRPPRPR